MARRELLIIGGKCYEIGNLGWNPKVCNPQVKKMVEGKDIRYKTFYVKKNSTDRHGYTLHDLCKEHGYGWADERLWKIIETEYETFEVAADWHEEFPESELVKFEDDGYGDGKCE